MTEQKSPFPWYKEGLRFKCTECGKCCTGPSGTVSITEKEMSSMAAFLNITLELFKRKYTKLRYKSHVLVEKKKQDGQYECIFLKDKKCTVYHERPSQCRTYPWWKENLNSEESWNLAAERCEGISKEAPLVPYEQIQHSLHLNE